MRAARLIGGLVLGLLAISLALSTPWAKAWAFERAAAWARSRHGLDLRATRFDYRLLALTVHVEGLTVSAITTADRPMVRASGLDFELAASALRGRLDFHNIRARGLQVVLDSTTREPRGTDAASAGTSSATLPPFSVDSVEVQDLDLVYLDQDVRLDVRDITAALRGFGRPNELGGTITVAGGVDVAFESEAFRIVFDHVEARVDLEERASVRSWVSASSRLGRLRADGRVPLAPDGSLDIRYDGDVALEQLRHWWSDTPGWSGATHVTGTVSGPLRSPEASFRIAGRDLAWSALQPSSLDASGRVSARGLVLDALSLASRGATFDGHGSLGFRSTDPSGFTARWQNAAPALIAELLDRPFESASRSAVAGTAALTWHGVVPHARALAGRVELTARGVAPDDSAIGSLTGDGRDGQWNIGLRQALDGDASVSAQTRVSLEEWAIADAPLTGTVDLETGNAGASLAQLQRLGLRVPSAVAAVGSARLRFNGAIEGTVGRPRVAGTIAVDGLSVAGVDGARVSGEVAVDTDALHASPLEVAIAGASATLRGVLPWRDVGGQGTIEARVGDLGRLAQISPESWRPHGTVDLTGTWTGSARDPSITVRLAGTNLTANGLAFDAWSATASLTPERIVVDDLQATQPAGGAITGSGSWSPTDSTVSAQMSGTSLSLDVQATDEHGAARTRAQLTGVSFDARVNGPVRTPDGTVTLEVAGADVDGHRLGAVTARLDAAAGTARITAGAPAWGARAEGQVVIDPAWPFDARLDLADTDIAALGRLAGASEPVLDGVDARLGATITAAGSAREPATLRASMTLAALDGVVRGLPLTLPRAGRLTMEEQRLRVVDPIRIALGATTADVGLPTPGAAAPGVAVALTGPLAEIVSLAPAGTVKDITAIGTVDADVVLGDRLDTLEPRGRVTIALTSLRRGEDELARDATAIVEADASRVRVTELHGMVLGSTVEGQADAPTSWIASGRAQAPGTAEAPATFSLKARLAAGPLLEAVRGAPTNVSGTLNLDVEGSASAPRLDAVRATLRDDGGTLTVGAFALNAERTTAVRLEDGQVHVDTFEWRGPESTFNARGSVGVVAGREGTLHVDGNASLALLSAVFPARLDGATRFDLNLTGAPGAREVQGTVALMDGSMVVPAWRLSLADWSGQVVIGADTIAVEGLHGQLNGGDATIEGRFPVDEGAARTDTLALTVRNAFFDVPRGLRSQLDADLQWTHTQAAARVTGVATVTARSYREPVTELTRVVSSLLDRPAGGRSSVPARFANTALDVRLSTVGPLSMTNSVARVELVPDLQLTGTMGQPALSGQVAVVDDGRIQVSGRQYRLRESRVDFSPERGLVPQLAIGGETRVGDYRVFLRLSGPATEIETALTSDPPLGERDLQTLLVTGQLQDLSRGSSSDQNAVGAVSGDVLGLAGQFVGFDAVTVSTTDDSALVSSDVDPALRLTVSKRLGNRFEVVLSDNLDDNELTWVIIYRPRPGFELRALSRDNTEFSGEFRQEIFFGPGVSQPRITAPSRVARERVAGVTVTGEPGLATADVLSVVQLGPGDRFEFSEWLDDRDRIAALYHDRGYMAARIVPTRQDVAGAKGPREVNLNYRITRGPETVLTVTGYNAPPEVVADLRRAWADSGLVELLDDDLTRVMRAHLTNRGFLRATIDVGVDRTRADRVTAVVQVDPGELSVERRLGFSGSSVFKEAELRASATVAGVAAAVWLDPAPLIEWLEAAYAAKGYPAASITVGRPLYAAATATLPVEITEGPLARVASLTITGTDRVTQSDALAATGLTTGSPYLPGGENTARQALDRYYRNLGYRDVRVDSAAQVNAANGQVGVTLRVSEGPRYVVQSVRTNGVESTRAVLVERATRIEPGSPASPSVADATRRRLYDIGTFRAAQVTFEPVGVTSTDTVPVDAVVSVQEAKRFLFLYGVEATNQYQSLFDQRITTGGVAADLRDRNFLGRGWTLGAGVRYEPSFESARLLLAVPRLGSSRVRTNVYADVRSEDRAETEFIIFRDDESTLTLEQRWRPWTPVELSWGYRYNYRDLNFQSRATGETLVSFTGHLASLAGAIVFDRRDNMFDAKRGWLASTTVEWGLRPLGSDFDYLRTLVRASYYQPVGPLTLASNVRWGNLAPIGGRPPLTVLDLFYTAGGTQTVRGYKQDSLSVYQLLGSPIGGSKLLVFNEELRVPLFWLLSAAAFADVGNTFTDESGIVLGDMAVGAGFGVRIRTPLAPIRLDLGFPVTSRTGQTSIRWHFSIGQIF